MKHFFINLPPYILSTITLLLVFYFTLSPKPLPNFETPFFEFDKVVHIIMMLCLYLIFAFDYTRRERHHKLSLSALTVLLIITILIGGFIELAQSTSLIHRSCDLGDFIADSLGAIIGCLISRPIISRLVK